VTREVAERCRNALATVHIVVENVILLVFLMLFLRPA